MTPLPPSVGQAMVWERGLKMVPLRIPRFWRRRGDAPLLVNLCFVKILDKPWMVLGRSVSRGRTRVTGRASTGSCAKAAHG